MSAKTNITTINNNVTYLLVITVVDNINKISV